MALSLFKKCISGCLRSSVARLVWIQKASSEASVTGVSLSRITLYLFFLLLFLSIKLFLFIIIHHIFFIPSSSCVSRSSRTNATVARCTSHKHFFFPVFNPGSLFFSLSSFLRKYSSSSSILRLDFTNHKHFSYWSLTLDLVFSPFPFFQQKFKFILHPLRLHKSQTFSPPFSTLVLCASPVRTLFFSRPSDWR